MLHIQILLYDSKRFLPDLLLGLLEVQSDSGICIHFLENSDQDSEGFLKKNKEKFNFEYTFDNEKKNLGFAAGHNYLFNKYGSSYGDSFMVLNPDTVPFFNFLDIVNDFKKQIPEDWGAIECCQFPKPHPKDYDSSTFETEWSSAAATIYKTKAFQEIGGFDENMFMYCEDVDLSWRLREAGYRLYFCSTAKIAHITRDLDKGKDPSFEEIHSKAGNLYLRYKYFGEGQVRGYQALIKDSPYYAKIMKRYTLMRENFRNADIKKYRQYKSPQIYPDTNYAFHRW